MVFFKSVFYKRYFFKIQFFNKWYFMPFINDMFKNSSSVCSLLIYINTLDICILILYLATLLNFLLTLIVVFFVCGFLDIFLYAKIFFLIYV